MKRRTLDFLFSIGGVVLAALLVILGLVLTSNATFAEDYVHDQLGQQRISFPPAEALSEEEQAVPCLVANAGQPITTGAQAECYANEFIGLHVKSIDGAEGETYASLGGRQRELRAAVAEAQASGDPAVADLQADLDAVNTARETLFKGETLRGLLLTTYGFSVLGTKGDQAATVAYAVAALLFLLSLAGFAHAFTTPRSVAFAPPEQGKRAAGDGRGDRELVGV